MRRTALAPDEAPELLAVIRFVRETPGSEALGIGFAMGYVQAAPAEALRGKDGIEVFDALGTMADRLAHRASFGAALAKPAQAALAAHLEVATRYGVRFRSYEREGRMQVCYDGEAFRRVLAMERRRRRRRARAALALTRPECVDPQLRPLERSQADQWRADVLERVDAAALPGLPEEPRADAAREHLQRAGLPAGAARPARRRGGAARAGRAGRRQQGRAHGGRPARLQRRGDADQRFALGGAAGAGGKRLAPARHRHRARPARRNLRAAGGREARRRQPAREALHLSLVWTQSASLNREGNALALAVQPMAAWRELWLFRKGARRLAHRRAAAGDHRPGCRAMPNSRAGCPAASRCWWRARRAATASTSAASSWCGWIR